ncbi:unnamed protein product [Hermetia illucens]|uniref:THAP-type domain-containing protein n=1 Tax=Hermetia illucens TaxID=343691 RepID=A0A7R8UW81_HERIL|nr:peroxynitrite isomerase THAP4-like isoform X3 [Hermetia illucens]CAD7088122.1 unnamed protein product [Hermetia illucens]
MKCSVFGCSTVQRKVPIGLSFFRFPKDERLRARWLKAIGREGWNPDYNRRVCALHFDTKDLVMCGSRKRLVGNAVPKYVNLKKPNGGKAFGGKITKTEFPHTNGISVSKRIVQKKLLKTPSPPPYIENGYSPIPGPSSSPEEQGVRYVPMSEGSFESRSSSPRNVVSTSGPKKKPKLSRKELRYQTDAALLQFLEQASDNSAKKTTEQAFGEFIANELEKIQCIDIREEVKWEIQLAIRKGIQQALQTNTHSSLCTVPPNQMEMESPSKEYFIINNVE